MLVLSRRKDESIMVGDKVEIMIVGIRGDQIRLGITAPKSIPVHRKEVYEAIRSQKIDKTEKILLWGKTILKSPKLIYEKK
jgi:carbon storage regulator